MGRVTAITNNTVRYNRATGIRVAGGSSGVSVQNNISTDNPSGSGMCPQAPAADAVDMLVDQPGTRAVPSHPSAMSDRPVAGAPVRAASL